MGYYLPPLPLLGCCVVSFDLYWQDNFLNNKIQSDKDNFLDNLIYEIAIMGVLGSIFRQDNFLTIYERFWHLGGPVVCLCDIFRAYLFFPLSKWVNQQVILRDLVLSKLMTSVPISRR